MADVYNAKVIYGSTVLMDLTQDDITAADVLSGKLAHGPDGAPLTGTCTYDADTSDATATAAEILATKTAYKNGSKLTGTMNNRGAVTGTIATKAGQYTIPQGYHDGSGNVSIDSSEQAKIIAGNIKQGVEILGVTGSYAGEITQLQSKTVTPSISADVTVTADTGYDALSQVTVSKISYVETTDAGHGGKIITIAGV